MMFSILDVTLILVIILCAVVCAARGIVDILFSAAAFFLALVGGVLFNSLVSVYFDGKVSIPFFSKIIAFVIIFSVIFIAVKILHIIVSKIFKGDIFGGLSHALGCVFGCLFGTAIAAICIFILSKQTFFDASGLLKGSFFYRFFAPFFASIRTDGAA
jgi:membrane protein required for colicin V production